VEAAIVVPVLMLIVLIVVQCALWAHAGQVAELAASEGNRIARSSPGGANAGLARADAVLRDNGSDLNSARVTAAELPNDQLRITVSGHAFAVLPGMSFPVVASEVGTIQEFRVDK
jgi:hypothetical protein